MMQSQGFRGEIFSYVSRYREEQRLDFKSQIPKLDTRDSQYKFMRHLIAFANVARRIGKPCWILFGVEDGILLLRDVRDQYPGKKTPKGWHNPQVNFHSKQEDGISKVFREIADNWIDPLPDLRYEYGEVNGVFVSYLEIRPEYPSRPYRLKRHFDKAPIGTVFIRRGSSTLPVPDDEVKNLLPASQIPYLDEKDWQTIIQPLQDPPFDEAYALFHDFPLHANAAREDALAVLRQKLGQGQKIIHVEGIAGQGKSVLLRALAYDLAMEHNLGALVYQTHFAAKVAVSAGSPVRVNELEVLPFHPVPVFLHLRTAFENTAQFEKRLVQEMGKELASQWDSIQPFFRIPGLRWTLILDALDELHNREEFVPRLNEWLRQLPDNVQVVLSARPYQPGHPNADVITLGKLNEDEIHALVKYYLDKGFAQLAELLEQDKTLDTHDLKPLRKVIDRRLVASYIFSVISTPRSVVGLVEAILQEIYTKLDLGEEGTSHNIVSNSPEEQPTTSKSDDNQPNDEHIEVFSAQEILAETDSDSIVSPRREDFENVQVIGVQFDNGGKVYYFDASDIDSLGVDDLVLVETSLGQHIGKIVEFVREPIDEPPGGWKPVLKVVGLKEQQESFLQEFFLPADAILLARVVNYLREEETERQKDLGRDPVDRLEIAQVDLDRLAWEKNWNDETFNWYVSREILRKESKRWNEYIGFIIRTSRRYWYKFLSVHLQALCAAEYALDMDLPRDVIFATIDKKRGQETTKLVVDILNQLYRDNGLQPVNFQFFEEA